MKKVYEILYSEKNVVAFAKFLAPRYRNYNWHWFDGIPDENRITSCLKSLVHDVENHLTTGGLFADRKEDGKIFIGVEGEESRRKLIPLVNQWDAWRKNLERKYRMIRLRDD